jgi:hypothetical protein
MKYYLFTLLFGINSVLSFGQTIEDIKNLGLTDSQLRTSFEKRQILLTDNSKEKTKKIKEGAFATIKLKGDSTKMEVVLEAFLTDTIIVSSWTPELTGKRIKLVFTEFKLLPLTDIEWIEYSVRHRGGTFWSAFILVIAGAEFVILPVIPFIDGSADDDYAKVTFPIMVVSGVVMSIAGIKLMKSLRPKAYILGTDWSYRVVKK